MYIKYRVREKNRVSKFRAVQIEQDEKAFSKQNDPKISNNKSFVSITEILNKRSFGNLGEKKCKLLLFTF